MKLLFYWLCTIVSVIGIAYIIFTSLFTVTVEDIKDEEKNED